MDEPKKPKKWQLILGAAVTAALVTAGLHPDLAELLASLLQHL